MKLLDEIISLLSDNSSELTNVLIKTKVLLYEIGHKELVEWVNNELNGYSEHDSLPDYRILPTRVVANMSNMAYRATAHPLPTMHLDESYKESLENAKMTQSIAVLEKFVANNEGSLLKPIPLEANHMFEKALGNGYRIETAWCEIQLTGVTSILTQVRSRLLDFVLELNEKFGGNLTTEELKSRVANTDAENLFNNAIFGDNATIIVGSGNSQRIHATIIKGDFNSLAKTLSEHAVSNDDINELKEAIAADALDNNKKKNNYGESVKSWLQKMLVKAVDASWNIELGVASSLLANALQKYYGWL